jgi:YbbR domain-containing protein
VNNLALKLSSLALATLLWFAIAAEKTSEMGISVPVELQNVPRDLEVTGDAVNSVEVRLRASPGIIQRLGPGEVSARVDLQGIDEGERIVHLTESAIRVPFGVQVVKISPSIITLRLERTLQKVVPVRPRLLGRPAPGYEVVGLTSQPPDVRVAGPKSRVQEVESAYTEPVSVEGAQSDVTDEVNIGLEDPLLRLQDNARVRVTVRVREVRARRVFQSLAVHVRGSGTVVPRSVEVVLVGPASAVPLLKPADVKPYVEVGDAKPGASLQVAVDLAPGLDVFDVESVTPPRLTLRAAPRGRR